MSHDHSHDHGHHHAPANFGSAFLIAISANGIFVVLQIIFALFANSTSLLADAIHNFGDVLGLIMAWVANNLLQRSPTENATYGMKKTSILAALVNGILLIFSCGIIAAQAVYKLFSPSEIHVVSVIIIAAVGIIVNGATAMLFMHGGDDLNIRGAFLHLFYDALISAGVVVSAILLYWTGWLWIDPVAGLLIAAVILKGTWVLFRDSFRLIIDAVPRDISLAAVRVELEAVLGVEQVHDLHVWALSTRENALSAHLLMPHTILTDEARRQITIVLQQKYNINHATIQVETDAKFCTDKCSTNIIF